jgi:cyclophilin family peptidyl-prolyl cis-trans isomerase
MSGGPHFLEGPGDRRLFMKRTLVTGGIAVCGAALVAALVLMRAGPTAVAGAHVSSSEGAPRVTMRTSVGDVVIRLYPDAAPRTVQGFLANCAHGVYDDTILDETHTGGLFGGTRWPDGSFKMVNTYNAFDTGEWANCPAPLAGRVAVVCYSSTRSESAELFICLSDAPVAAGKVVVFGEVEDGLDALLEAAASKDVDGWLAQPVVIYGTDIGA